MSANPLSAASGGVNTAPAFVRGSNQTVLEDTGLRTVVNWAKSITAGRNLQEIGQAMNFIVANNNTALFAIQPAISSDGTLTFSPAANAFGSAVVTVRLHDDGGTAVGGVDTSAARTFRITVKPVNDAPTFIKGADQTVLPNSVTHAVRDWALALLAGPSNESRQRMNFVVTNNNPSLFAVQPRISSDGVLTYRPRNLRGTALINVTIRDSGGTANGGINVSSSQTFVIDVDELTSAEFRTRIDQVDAANPLPTSGFMLDWENYRGNSTTPAEKAFSSILNWYAGKPGVERLDFASLSVDTFVGLAELRARVGARSTVLDAEIGQLDADYISKLNMNAGVVLYSQLRRKIVEQAYLQLLDENAANLQIVRDAEVASIQDARTLAVRSVAGISLFSTPADSVSPWGNVEAELEIVRHQQEVLVADLGVLETGLHTEQALASAANFQASFLAAAAAAQELQTAGDLSRTRLVALQAREIELQELAEHPADHLQWSPLTGVDFGLAELAGTVKDAALFPDNKSIATTTGNNVVEIRSTITGEISSSLTFNQNILALATTVDGRIWTLDRGTYSTVTLTDPTSGQTVWQQQLHSNFIALTASVDGSLVAVVLNKTVTILRRNGDLVTSEDFVFTDNVQAGLHFSPDMSILAVPMQDSVILLDLQSKSQTRFTGFRDLVNDAAWSPDGTLVAGADAKGFVQIIDVPSSQIIGSFQLPQNAGVITVGFSPNQAIVCTGDGSVGLMFWDITRMNDIREYARSDTLRGQADFQRSKSGNTILVRTTGNKLLAYSMPDAGRGAPISRTTPPILNPVPPTPAPTPDSPAWSQSGKVNGTLGTVDANPFTSITPDGQSFVIVVGGAVQLRSIATGQVTQTYDVGGSIDFAAVTANGQLVVVADDAQNVGCVLTVRDLNSGVVSLTRVFSSPMMAAAVDSAGDAVVLTEQSFGSRAKIIHLTSGTIDEVPLTENHWEALGISPSGKFVAIGLNDGSVVVYDRDTKSSRTLTGLSRQITALAWSQGTDALFAAADDNAHLALYAPTSAQAFSVFSAPNDSDRTTALHFSQNNLLLFRSAYANGLLTFDVSSTSNPRVSDVLPLLALNRSRSLALSTTGATLFASAFNTNGGGTFSFITGVSIPGYGRMPSQPPSPPTPGPGTPSTPPPQNAAQQNELAAPTTLTTLNATQQRYLLDSIIAYFTQRALERGAAGVPSLFLSNVRANPALIGVSVTASYRDFYAALVADMNSKWPLAHAPVLEALAGGSGVYSAPATPLTPPSPKPIQVNQQQTVEQLLLNNLRSPVRLSAGQWVNVVDLNSTTHSGPEQYAVDLSLIGLANNANPNFDLGQSIYAPMGGQVKSLDRQRGRLALEHILTQADGSTVVITTVYFHLKIADVLQIGMQLSQGVRIGKVWNLTDGTIQSNGETTIDAHLHFSAHLGGENGASLNLDKWLAQEKIWTMTREDGVDTGGERVGTEPRILSPDQSARFHGIRYLYEPSRSVPGVTAGSVDTHSMVGRLFLGYLQRFDDESQGGTLGTLDNMISQITGLRQQDIAAATHSSDPAQRASLLKALFIRGQYGEIFTKENQNSSQVIRNAVVNHPPTADRALGVPYSDNNDERIRVRFDLTSDQPIDHVSLFILNQKGEPTTVTFPLVTVYDQFYVDLPLNALGRAFHSPMNANFSIELKAYGGTDGKRIIGSARTSAFRVELARPVSSDVVTNYELNATTFFAWAATIGTFTTRFDTQVNHIAGRTVHGGYDIDKAMGDPITAYIGGTFLNDPEGSVTDKSGWGLTVIIVDSNGNRHRYAHLSSVESWVKKGAKITGGQRFASMGASGAVFPAPGGDGSHLHFEIKDPQGNLLDPGK